MTTPTDALALAKKCGASIDQRSLWPPTLKRSIEFTPEQFDAFVAALTSAPAEPQPCPRCDGSGEVTVMSDGGPDAYEVPVECPHCHGNQTLEAAYNGVVKLLDRSEDKYRECAAILYLGRAGRKASDRITEIAEYITKPGAQMDWAHDRLIALADMAKVAAPAETPPAAGAIDAREQEVLALFRARIAGRA